MQDGRESRRRLNTVLVVRDGDVAWQDWSTNSNLDRVPRYKTCFSASTMRTEGPVQGLLEHPPGTCSVPHCDSVNDIDLHFLD